jgi:hypothetical protein
MFSSFKRWHLSVGIVLAICLSSTQAQQEVYKWVDQDGVVHFSETPPSEADLVGTDGEVGSRTFAPTEPPPATTQPIDRTPAPAPAKTIVQAEEEPPVAATQAAVEVNIADMSLSELGRRCDVAREKVIAPMREAEIASCKEQKRNDPDWCERFNADYGEGGRTVSGSIRPRMFDDLPECVDHMNESNRRGR